jgi:DnaK suppressor protein
MGIKFLVSRSRSEENIRQKGGNMAISIGGRQEMLKRMLLQKQLELEANLRQELQRRKKEEQDLFASSVRDEGDRSHFGLEQEIGRRQMVNCNEKLKRIQNALERLNETGYGVCEECGAEISEKRLQVMPFAVYCLECQENQENQELLKRIGAWTRGGNRSRDH